METLYPLQEVMTSRLQPPANGLRWTTPLPLAAGGPHAFAIVMLIGQHQAVTLALSLHNSLPQFVGLWYSKHTTYVNAQ